MKFPESDLAHHLLDGSDTIIEIGASAHNPFNIKCNKYFNVDLPKEYRQVYETESATMGEGIAEVHIEACGNKLPFDDNSIDGVLSSHVIEHFYNPLSALNEWYRVLKPGGYMFIICPHVDRTFGRGRDITTIDEIIERQTHTHPEDGAKHYTVWRTQDFIDFVTHFGFMVTHYQDVDDKVGNGFTVVIQK